MVSLIAFLALAAWLYLFFLHGGFWRSGPELAPAVPVSAPDVDIVVPARDEAATIGRVIASLAAQDYAGRFTITLVDDGSTDGTAEAAGSFPNLTVLPGMEKPPGWSGKLWAVRQGVAAGAAPLVFLADADIVHDPRHLATLVARLEAGRLKMVSEMVRLNCASTAEKALVPAFVFFFQMLYPFARVNARQAATAAAAGGTILVRRDALAEAGGVEAIRDTLIDDVSLAKRIKRLGPVFLSHSGLATSIRPYPDWADVWRMISRCAFTQLRHSAVILAGTILGLALVWLAPLLLTVFAHGRAWFAGLLAYILSTASYFPTLRRYRLSRAWAFALPAIALFYMAATLGSAVHAWQGKGAVWKNRVYGTDTGMGTAG